MNPMGLNKRRLAQCNFSPRRYLELEDKLEIVITISFVFLK